MSETPREAEKLGAAADPQAAHLYAWEKAWREWNHSNLTIAECREVARRACVYLKIPQVRLTFRRTPHYSECDYATGQIAINTRLHKNVATICHEVAHRAVFLAHGEIAAHGPEFVRVYMRLLLRARLAPRSALIASLKHYGVEF